jgi:hypothetical protein
VKVRSNWWFNAIASGAIGTSFAVVAIFAVRRWDVAEPLIWASGGIGVVVVLVLRLFGRQLDKVHILEQRRENRAQAALRKVGLDVETIRKVITKYI